MSLTRTDGSDENEALAACGAAALNPGMLACPPLRRALNRSNSRHLRYIVRGFAAATRHTDANARALVIILTNWLFPRMRPARSFKLGRGVTPQGAANANGPSEQTAGDMAQGDARNRESAARCSRARAIPESAVSAETGRRLTGAMEALPANRQPACERLRGRDRTISYRDQEPVRRSNRHLAGRGRRQHPAAADIEQIDEARGKK